MHELVKLKNVVKVFGAIFTSLNVLKWTISAVQRFGQGQKGTKMKFFLLKYLCFQNVDQLWNSPNDPDFTYCFEETALLWTPCSFLLLLTFPHLLSLWWNKDGKQKRKNGEYKSLLSTEENESEDEDYQCSKSHAAIPCSTFRAVKMVNKTK